MSRRALVLGAGGNAAIAWEIGVITGMADEGLDVGEADLVVGTSAGSIVGAQITSGQRLEDLFERQADPGRQEPEPAPPVDFTRWRGGLMQARRDARSAAEFLQRMGSLASDVPPALQAGRRDIIAARLPVHTWPEQPLVVAAVDADSGERRVFDRADGVPLVDAVAASCAVAGIWPAVAIEGHRYIDGGFYSIDNADLAAECDSVLILTLPARVPPLCVASLDAAVETLQRNGARVEIVHPDQTTEAAFASVGGNLLDPSVSGERSSGRAGTGPRDSRAGRGGLAALALTEGGSPNGGAAPLRARARLAAA